MFNLMWFFTMRIHSISPAIAFHIQAPTKAHSRPLPKLNTEQSIARNGGRIIVNPEMAGKALLDLTAPQQFFTSVYDHLQMQFKTVNLDTDAGTAAFEDDLDERGNTLVEAASEYDTLNNVALSFSTYLKDELTTQKRKLELGTRVFNRHMKDALETWSPAYGRQLIQKRIVPQISTGNIHTEMSDDDRIFISNSMFLHRFPSFPETEPETQRDLKKEEKLDATLLRILMSFLPPEDRMRVRKSQALYKQQIKANRLFEQQHFGILNKQGIPKSIPVDIGEWAKKKAEYNQIPSPQMPLIYYERAR
jgi:hypothetical protein